ncbi:DUF3291 domain-containing protein [Grimontia sp. S25]|uniref:DUF3291 domain-containing protein n=1 Tax=Grimontia sedimenti TaxID=2711294 RepID=A0A6M1RBJ6_9GAMM|nr:DUF3291 domain-containing protein [Grimontia sedimenti]NGN97540.1 DUF3291 domain-containing protein [Grimontia sedimenti]
MHLAELNISIAKANIDDPLLKDFVDNIPSVNSTAESSRGYVWRFKDSYSKVLSYRLFGNPNTLINLSVWESADALKQFMFKTHHVGIMKRRNEWFEKPNSHNFVMWWIPEGHIPSLEEAKERLEHLREHGESEYAFTFRQFFEPSDSGATKETIQNQM